MTLVMRIWDAWTLDLRGGGGGDLAPVVTVRRPGSDFWTPTAVGTVGQPPLDPEIARQSILCEGRFNFVMPRSEIQEPLIQNHVRRVPI